MERKICILEKRILGADFVNIVKWSFCCDRELFEFLLTAFFSFYDTETRNLVEAPVGDQPNQIKVNGKVPFANGTNSPDPR